MPIPAGLLASVASSAITTAGNIALSERQAKRNEALQDKMNEYNLPVNQVKRLQDAGINPNALSMSNGMDVQGNTSAGVNPYSTPSLSDPLSLASNSFLAMQQGTTEEQMREVRKGEAVANIELMKANAEKLGVDTQYQSILNSFAAAREQAALQGQKFQNRLTLWQTSKVKQEARQLAKYIDEVMPEEIKKTIVETNLTVGQLDQVIATIANINASTENIEAQTETQKAQTGLVESENYGKILENARYDEVTDKLLEQYQATINKLSAECNLTQQEAFYYLYELAKKYSIRFMGLPVGQGSLKDYGTNQQMMKNAADSINP